MRPRSTPRPHRVLATVAILASATSCYVATTTDPPASFTAAEPIPARPAETTNPMAAVRWTLNYDLRQFDAVWAWLHREVPAGPERARAIGAAALLAAYELDRADLVAEGLSAFDAAITAFPGDARLPTWRAALEFLIARVTEDGGAAQVSLAHLRDATSAYPAFTPFGVTLTIGGWEDASAAEITEARAAMDTVIAATNAFQLATSGADLERSRRIFDTPIAPYNVPAMQAMIGDLAARAGDVQGAQRAYYTSLRANGAARWPWRAEVQRRLDHTDAVVAGFAARPATEYALGSEQRYAMGITAPVVDARFGGRIGNGSCTVCHTHASVLDAQEAPAAVGWVKARIVKPREVPNMQGVAFLLPEGSDPVPVGFGIGPFVDPAAPADFWRYDELFDGTFLIPAEPGHWFVAVQATVDGGTWQGYLPQTLGQQWFLDVKAGQLLDVTAVGIEMKLLP